MLHIANHFIYKHPLPQGHRFPMIKYELIPEQLLHEGTIIDQNIFEPKECVLDTILLTHTIEYVNNLLVLNLSAGEQRKIGFPLTKELVEREFTLVQGTIDCCKYAYKYGISLNVAGGTHHAFAERGEGFCLLNDIAIATNYLLHNKQANKVLIIDLDVHQGNGTASIFTNSKSVFTFSMHGGNNYPFHKESSTLDVPLKDGINDNEYLWILKENLVEIISSFNPDFAFYNSGVDVLSTDKYGKLNLSLEGCKQRDKLVFETCIYNNIPIVAAMGGGYSQDIKIIVEAHCNTFRVANYLIG